MQTKTKTLIAVAVILVVSIAAVVFMWKAQKTKNIQEEQIQTIQQETEIDSAVQNTKEEVKNTDKKTEDVQLKVTEVTEGTVLGINENILTIKNSEGKQLELKITTQSSFYIMENGKVVLKTKGDIKEGTRLMVEYQQQNMEILAAKIE